MLAVFRIRPEHILRRQGPARQSSISSHSDITPASLSLVLKLLIALRYSCGHLTWTEVAVFWYLCAHVVCSRISDMSRPTHDHLTYSYLVVNFIVMQCIPTCSSASTSWCTAVTYLGVHTKSGSDHMHLNHPPWPIAQSSRFVISPLLSPTQRTCHQAVCTLLDKLVCLRCRQ